MPNPCFDLQKKYKSLLVGQERVRIEVETARKTRKTADAYKAAEKLRLDIESLKKNVAEWMDTPEFTRNNIKRVCALLKIDPVSPYQFRVSDENELVSPLLFPTGDRLEPAMKAFERVLTHPQNRILNLNIPTLNSITSQRSILTALVNVLKSPENKIKRLTFDDYRLTNFKLRALSEGISSPNCKIEELRFDFENKISGAMAIELIGLLKQCDSVIKKISFSEFKSDFAMELLTGLFGVCKEVSVRYIHADKKIEPVVREAAEKAGVKLTIGEWVS